MDWRISGIILTAGLVYLPGLFWGLPSTERARLILSSESARDPSFFDSLKQQRDFRYEEIDRAYRATGSLFVSVTPFNVGEIVKLRGWEDKPENVLLLHSFSSFLLRSADGDEQNHLRDLARIDFKRLKWNGIDFMHAGLFTFGMGFFLQAGAWTGFIRQITPDVLYYYQNPDEMAAIHAAARFFMLLCGLFAAWFLYKLGTAVDGAWAARAAVFLFLAAPVTIGQSHVIKGHIVGTAMVFVLMMVCLRLMQDIRWRWYWAGGIWAGMMFATQPQLWYLCLYVPMAHIAGGVWIRRQAWRNILLDPKLWLTPVFGLMGFLFLMPFAITDFRHWYDGSLAFGGKLQPVTWKPWLWVKAWVLGLSIGLNQITFLFFAAGGFWICLRSFFKGTPPQRLIALFMLWNFLIYGIYCGEAIGNSIIQTRRFISMAGLCSLYAAWFLKILKDNKRPDVWGTIVRNLPAVVLAYALAVGLFFNYNLYADAHFSTYMQAGRWINENIPKRTSIGLSTFPHTNLHPPFDFANYELWVNGHPKAYSAISERPAYFVLSRNPILIVPFRRFDEPFPDFERQYELVQRFGREPDWTDFTNHFTLANFTVWIYQKRDTVILPGK